MGQIYISYSQNHKEAARRMRDALETWGHTVWMDDPDTLFDKELADQLERGLRGAQIVVALLSPTSVKSRTVRREIAIAKSLDKTIVPVLMEPMPNIDPAEAKFIDATENLQGAISRLVKVVDAHMSKLPPDLPEAPAVDEAEAAEDENGRLNPLVLIAAVAAIAVIIIFSLVALGKRPDDQLSDADVQATMDAQATTIVVLQTQAALEDQPVVTRITATPTPTRTLSPTPAVMGPTDEPSPTSEVLLPPAASDTPTLTPTPDTSMTDMIPGENLLTNPGFESLSVYNETEQVADGWTPWFLTGGDYPSYQQPPIYGPIAPFADRIHEGVNGQQISGEYVTFDGGVYQQVSGITPGATIQFSVQAYVWSSSFEDLNTSEGDGDVLVQVGIDPTGSTDGQSAAIVWSDPVEVYDSFNEYAIVTTASSDTVTAFVRAYVDAPVLNTVVYLDDALLAAQ